MLFNWVAQPPMFQPDVFVACFVRTLRTEVVGLHGFTHMKQLVGLVCHGHRQPILSAKLST